MSKAFVKENDDLDLDGSDVELERELHDVDSSRMGRVGADGSDDDSQGSPSAVLVKNYITPAGLERLTAELTELLQVERPKLVETIAWAASNGDRSENADYIYGKKRLREIDRRIRFLRSRIDRAEVVDPEHQSSDRVLFGAFVDIEFESGERKTVQILGVDEADPKKGFISWNSPLGKALLQGRVGDVVQMKTPKGFEEVEILALKYGKGT